MIIDGRTADASAPLDYDVLIVGSGPAGVTVAHEFGGTGLRVAVLESGGEDFEPENQELYDGQVTGLEEVDLTAIRLRMLGGTSNHWGGHCLPLDPIDFSRAPLSGMTGWPVSREAMLPFYARAHEYLKLGAFEYGTYEPKGVSADDLLLADNDMVENSVLRLSANPPTNFGERYRELPGARTVSDLWLWTNLTGLDLSPEGVVRGVRTPTLAGVERTFTARTVVLACGAVENARQLLLANAANGTSFGDAGDLIGACYMDHPAGGSAFLWPHEPLRDKANWSRELYAPDGTELRYVWRLHDAVLEREGLQNAQFYLIPYSSDSDARGSGSAMPSAECRDSSRSPNGRSAASGRNFSLSAQLLQVHHRTPTRWSPTRCSPKAASTGCCSSTSAEQQPNRASRVTLDGGRDALGLPLPAARLVADRGRQAERHPHHRTDRPGGGRGRSRPARVRGGARRALLEHDHLVAPARHRPGWPRARGTASSIPTACVHGTRNLYVAGGSVMPTGGRANPTLTITALAIRLADHLKAEQGV